MHDNHLNVLCTSKKKLTLKLCGIIELVVGLNLLKC